MRITAGIIAFLTGEKKLFSLLRITMPGTRSTFSHSWRISIRPQARSSLICNYNTSIRTIVALFQPKIMQIHNIFCIFVV